MTIQQRQDIQGLISKPSNWLVYRKLYLNTTTNWTISNLKLFALLFMTLLAKFMIGPKRRGNCYELRGGGSPQWIN